MFRRFRRAVVAVGSLIFVFSLLSTGLAQDRQRPLSSVPPPVPPAAKSPADRFRELLAASPEQRESMLARHSSETREQIRAKLREFDKLSPSQREFRLRLAQLQFSLSPLLRAKPDDRASLLERAPSELRPLLTE